MNGSIPANVSGYTAMYDLLEKNWGTQIQTYGDSIEYHHHFEVYNNGIWQRYDNGPDAGYPDYQMTALDHMIIDDNFYPTSFRSGWNIMSTPLSNWIEQWFPFDYCPQAGGWSPVHAYPCMNHLQTQTLYFTYFAQVQQAFVQAKTYGSSIYSFYVHADDNMVGNITDLSTSLKTLVNDQLTYPGVTYKYVTASQAMQLALGYTDVTPPTFQVSRNGSTYIINSSETLWNNNPFITVEYRDGNYTNIAATPVANNTWTVNVQNSTLISKIGVAANDQYGNPGVVVFSPLTPPQGSIPSAPTVPQTTSPEVQVPINGITASSYVDSNHTPDKAIDGNETTSNYWGTSSGLYLPQWLTLDMWSLVPINRVTTHFYDADSRTYTYSINVSTDGLTWTNVVPSKTGVGIVTDNFTAVMARFVKLTVTGDTATSAAHVEEIKAFQATLVPQPTPTPVPTATPTPVPTATPSPTPIPTATPTPVPTTVPTPNPTPVPTTTPTPVPTASPTPTVAPTAKPTVSPSSQPTATPSTSPKPAPTLNHSPSQTTTDVGQGVNHYLFGIVIAIAIVSAFAASLTIVRKKKTQNHPLNQKIKT